MTLNAFCPTLFRLTRQIVIFMLTVLMLAPCAEARQKSQTIYADTARFLPVCLRSGS